MPSSSYSLNRQSGDRSVTQRQSNNQNYGSNRQGRLPGQRTFSVDSVLQYGGDLPSQQRRALPPARRAGVGLAKNADQRQVLTGRMGTPHIPARSTKISEKLVLIPETEELDERGLPDNYEDGEDIPLTGEEEILQAALRAKRKSYAERLPKSRRTEKLSRVTAYCTAQSYKLKATAAFLREQHGAKTKLYDECLYAVYHLPILPGSDGYRVRSSPILKNPGGKAVLDVQIERSEQRDYRGYFEDSQSYEVFDQAEEEQRGRSREDARSPNPPQRTLSPDAASMLHFAEMFVFSYGVVVFWNFTEHQEKNVLADMAFYESESEVSLNTGPLADEDFETEEFHFEYSPEALRPRVYNDMFTLCTGDHMIKLAMSHAISQSTKLCYFEERMHNTIIGAQYIPKRLASTGTLGLTREEVIRILGQLFKSRVDVNLSSTVLDVPNFFWESEPTLHPLYSSLRGKC
jgi:uncharacterized Rmd1/YagE family protein